MKRFLMWTSALLFVFAVGVAAQAKMTLEEHAKIMKANVSAFGPMNKAIASASYADARTQVAALRTNFMTLQGMWASVKKDDAVAIVRQMKALNVNPRMYGLTVGVDTLKFYEALGRDAEFVYGVTPWVPELVELRAGGLIPVARQYPGAGEFVLSYKREFPGADSSYHAAAGYAGCEILVEALRRAGRLDNEKLRDAILKMDRNTVFGRFRVDPDGVQIGHKMLLFQWPRPSSCSRTRSVG